MSGIVEFNAQMYVSEQLNRQLLNTTQDVAIRCVNVLAEKFNFDADEAIQMLGLNLIKLERKMPEKVVKAKAVKVAAAKSAFPLPYNGEFNESCCYALRQNNGLYTQCSGVRKGENAFCKGCASQMQKMGAEMPEYGTIQQRMAAGIMEYVDPKGRKPTAYAKIMKKYKINEEQVLAEAVKFNINIDPIHFVVSDAEGKRGRPKAEKAPKEKGAKGRPKKSKKVLQIEGEDDDLFAALVAEANEVEGDEFVLAGKKKGKTDEEKEAERLQKEAEKQAKKEAAEKAKAEKEAKLAAEKAEKEAKLLAEKEARAAKKAAEEAEKQAKKEAAEKAKAEKEAKLAAEKAEKEAKKSAKKPEGKAKAAAEPEEEQEPDVVKKIEFEGKKYLKSKKTGIVYDYNIYVKEGEQVVVGKWSESANKIIFDDAEEEEEEYDM
jgi:chemotaxis protein histidine kinase CheA